MNFVLLKSRNSFCSRDYNIIMIVNNYYRCAYTFVVRARRVQITFDAHSVAADFSENFAAPGSKTKNP